MFSRNQVSVLVTLTILVAFTSANVTRAQQTGGDCSRYYDAVLGGGSSEAQAGAAAISESLLADWKIALPCLANAIGLLRNEVAQTRVSPATRGKFLRATGAVRTIFANSAKDGDLRKAIDTFRTADRIDVIATLAYAARGQDYDMRLNAVLVLSNVIRNANLCAVLDHLYDPSISAKGRANLLSVASVVAPWAYYENYHNISRVRAFTLERIGEDKSPDIKQTLDILENIKLRLDSQTDKSNWKVSIGHVSSSELDSADWCQKYKPSWGADYLKY